MFEEYAAWLIVAVTALFLAGYLIINAPSGRKAVHAMLHAKGRFFSSIVPKADLPLLMRWTALLRLAAMVAGPELEES